MCEAAKASALATPHTARTAAVATAKAGGQHSLAATLDAVLTFLRTPLHPCEHCDTS